MRRKSLNRYAVGLTLVAMIFAALLGSIQVPVATGEKVMTTDCAVEFSNAASNDASSGTDRSNGDPAECGTWTIGDTAAPSTWSWAGNTHPENKEVASIDPELDSAEPQVMRITVDNGYPCYYGNVAFTIDNAGSLPVSILGIKLTRIQGVELALPVDIVACSTMYVDADALSASQTLNEDVHDFSLHLRQLEPGQQIAAGSEAWGDLCLHVEQGAEQGTTYSFSISIDFECGQGGGGKTLEELYDGVVMLAWSYPGGDSYFDIHLSGMPAGAFPGDGTYNGWCVEHRTMGSGWHKVRLHSSLDVSALDPPYNDQEAWNKINWILNNCPRTRGDRIEILNDGTRAHSWGPMQRAIWYFMPGSGYRPSDPKGTGAWLCIEAAEAHGDFVPGPGELAAVICEQVGESGPWHDRDYTRYYWTRYQTVIIEVDP
jgi:hypothetical protein